MKTSVLKPGYLVSLKTSLRGGVNYARIDIEPDHETADGARVAKWETRRAIPDPEEFERASSARSKARALVASVCCTSSFGLLCPSSDEEKLFDAIGAAREVADAHNGGASLTRVEVFVLVGRVAQDDAEAARAIGSEIRELLEAMRAGIAAADPRAIREAATKAKNLGAMLSADVAAQVSGAIVEARAAARAIVARIEKAGETAASVVAQCSTARIESARFAFLDLDEGTQATSEAPAARGIDIDISASAAEVYATPAPMLELF